MKINFQFQPLTVSFGNAESREVSGPASDIEGYYKKHGMPHDHNAGAVKFFRIAENNTFAKARDQATQAGYPSPWDEDGSFFWDIPNKFKTITESGDGKPYTNVIQKFVIEDAHRQDDDHQGRREGRAHAMSNERIEIELLAEPRELSMANRATV